jgi:prepilin-type N-terminal cleavage/methylation domain-containing protein
MFKFRNKKPGFTVVEILIAIAIFASSGTAITYLLVDSGRSNQQSRDRFFAATMAEAGLEATRNIRDGSWTDLVDGNHGLSQPDGVWTFSGTNDSSGKFTRQIQISTISEDEKLITATVSWTSAMGTSSNVIYSTYLANLNKAAILPPSWDKLAIVGAVGTGVTSGNKNPFGVFVLGNYAYLATDHASDSDPEFFVFDITTPNTPKLVGKCLIGKKVNSVFVAGNYAYLATQQTSSTKPEIAIVRITDPANPTVVSRITLSGNTYAKDIAVVGNYAFIATLSSSNKEFFIVDVTNPEHPGSVVGSLEFGNNLNAISVSGNFAYVATSNNSKEIQIINISNTATPTISRTYDNPGNADGSDILISGNNLYLSTLSNGSSPNFGIFTVNTSNPTNIAITNVSQMSYAANINTLALDAANNQVFLGTSLATAEITSINIIAPQVPIEKATVDLPDAAVSVFFNGSNLYVADNAVDQQLIVIGQGQ